MQAAWGTAFGGREAGGMMADTIEVIKGAVKKEKVVGWAR